MRCFKLNKFYEKRLHVLKHDCNTTRIKKKKLLLLYYFEFFFFFNTVNYYYYIMCNKYYPVLGSTKKWKAIIQSFCLNRVFGCYYFYLYFIGSIAIIYFKMDRKKKISNLSVEKNITVRKNNTTFITIG